MGRAGLLCSGGGTHGILLMINHQWRRLHIQLPDSLCWAMTFLCVTGCWVLFRAESFGQALGVLSAMADVGHIMLPIKNEKDLAFLQVIGVTFAPWMMHVHLERALGTLAALLLALRFLPNPLELMKKSFQPDWKWSVGIALGLVLGILHIAKNSPFLYFQF